MIGNGGGWELINVDRVSLRSLFDFGSVEIGVRIAVCWFCSLGSGVGSTKMGTVLGESGMGDGTGEGAGTRCGARLG